MKLISFSTWLVVAFALLAMSGCIIDSVQNGEYTDAALRVVGLWLLGRLLKWVIPTTNPYSNDNN